jgi:hypothetical protein
MTITNRIDEAHPTGVNAWANSPLKKGATAGLPSSASGKHGKNTAGQASSGTQIVPNMLFQRAAKERTCKKKSSKSTANALATCVSVALLLATVAWTTSGLAQQQSSGEMKLGALQMKGESHSPPSGGSRNEVPSTLDEALARAMEWNPAIVTARAKVSLAQAELNATQMEVARRIVDLRAEHQTQEEILKSARSRFEGVERMHKTGGVGGDYTNFEAARVAVLDATAKLARIETELRYLIGQETTFVPTRSSSGSTPLTKSRQTAAPLQLPKGPMVEKVRKALLTPTELLFTESPLRDVMDFMKTFHHIEIQLDNNALADAGIGTDTPITIELKGISLSAALQAWDDKFPNLKLVVRDYGILVTTPDRAQEQGYFPVVEFARLSGSGEAAAPKKPSEPFDADAPEKPKSPPLKPVPPSKK